MHGLRTLLMLLRRVGARHMASHPLRSAITLLGVAVGVAMLMGVRGITLGIEDAFAGMVDRVAVRAQLMVGGVGTLVPSDAVEQVAGTPGVAHAAGVLEGAVSAPALKDKLLVVGVDFLGDTYFLQAPPGDAAEPQDDVAAVLKEPFGFLNSVENALVGAPFARTHRLAKGDTFEVTTPGGRRPLKVAGVLSAQASEAMNGGAVAIMSLDAAELLLGNPGRLTRVDVALAEGASVDAVSSELKKRLGNSLDVRHPESLGTMGSEVTSVFRRGLEMSSLVALFVALGIIYNTVLISVMQRRREMSILRALGAEGGVLQTALVLESAALGAVGGLLGALGGHGMARAALQGAHDMLSALYLPIRPEAARMGVWDVVLAVLVGTVASGLASLVPSRAAQRVSPVEGMRRGTLRTEHPEVRVAQRLGATALLVALAALCTRASLVNLPVIWGATAAAGLVSLAVFVVTPVAMVAAHRLLLGPATRLAGITGRLAVDNLKRTLTTGAANISALATAALVVVALGAYVESFVLSLRTWMGQTIGAPLVVMAGSTGSGLENLAMGPEVEAAMRSVDGVTDVVGVRVTNQPLGAHTVKLRATDVEGMLRHEVLQAVEGTLELAAFRADPPACAISESTAHHLGIRLGDSLQMQTLEGPRAFRVAAVVVDYASTLGVVTVDRQVFQRWWKDNQTDVFQVYLRPGVAPEDVRRTMLDRIGTTHDLLIQSNREFQARMDETVGGFFWLARLLIGLAMAVATLGIINTLQANVLDRVREVGMLRAVGAQVAQVESVVVLEALAMSLVALVLGALAGLGTGAAMIRTLMHAQTGWSLPFAVPWATLLANAVVTLLVTLVAARLPARAAARLSPVEALAWE